jgi:hypothetical protein
MVRFFKIFLLFILFTPSLSSAQEVSFEAYIDRENINVGENFQIKLELINAQPQAAPDLSVLPTELKVTSQQQQSNLTIINGVQAQNISWVLDIVADKEGTYNIPQIKVQTASGELATKAFKIFVKPASEISATTEDNSVFIDVLLENQNPYIDEPILYKTTIYHLNEISNAELVTPKSDGALIEQISQPKPSKQILNGINYKVIQVDYLITPIKTGEVEISPSILRGKIASDIGVNSVNSLDNFFNNFAGMPSQLNREFKAFTVASKPVKITVKSPEENVNPWLVLSDLQIDEELKDLQFNQQENRYLAKVGEPINRKIRLTAYGKSGESLPDIEPLFKTEDFKIYADTPEFTKEIIPGEQPITERLKGVKTQNFTFIPQKAGMLNLPELSIKYWNLKEGKIETSNLPAKIITASLGNNQPAAATPNSNETKPAENENNVAAPVIEQPKTLEQKLEQIAASPQAPNLILIALLLVICIIMFVSFKIFTKAKNNREEFDEDLINPVNENKIRPRKIIDESKNKKAKSLVNNFADYIANASDFIELQQGLQKFGYEQMFLSLNSGAMIICNEMVRKFSVNREIATELAKELDGALYASKQVSFKELKNNFSELLKNIVPENSSNKKTDGLTRLNPDF